MILMSSSPRSSTLMMGPGDPQHPVLEDHDWGDGKLPSDSELVQDFLLQLGVHNSMGPNRIIPEY